MPMVTVGIELRRRRIVLAAEEASPPAYGWPGNWEKHCYEFSLLSQDGIQENPGAVFVRSATSQQVLAVAPVSAELGVGPGVEITAIGVPSSTTTRTVSGVWLWTNPLSAGVHQIDPRVSGEHQEATVVFVEGREIADIGTLRGQPTNA